MLSIDANVWIAAFDPAVVFHAESVALFSRIALRSIAVYAPEFVELEVACAVSRRRRDSIAGIAAGKQLMSHPLLVLTPINTPLLAEALRIGRGMFLRGADALYAATALVTQTALVTWDEELVKRVGGVTPIEWLAANA